MLLTVGSPFRGRPATEPNYVASQEQQYTVLKFIIACGGFAVVILGVIVRAAVFPPKLLGTSHFDERTQTLCLLLKSKRATGPIHIYEINIPTTYRTTLRASPPNGFTESAQTFTPVYPYDGEQRELVEWKGNVEIRPRHRQEIRIPIGHLSPIDGSIQVSYEARLLVGSLGGWVFVAFKIAA